MSAEAFEISKMTIEQYDEMLALWQRIPGIGLSQADERGPIQRFLEYNPDYCFVARKNGSLVGTILGGFDGRRGYLHHVAVDPLYQHGGIGRALVEKTMAAFTQVDIRKVHLFVYSENESGQNFWLTNGWYERKDLKIFSRDIV